MSAPKHTPGYRVTTDGRVFSTEHNWRGYGDRERHGRTSRGASHAAAIKRGLARAGKQLERIGE